MQVSPKQHLHKGSVWASLHVLKRNQVVEEPAVMAIFQAIIINLRLSKTTRLPVCTTIRHRPWQVQPCPGFEAGPPANETDAPATRAPNMASNRTPYQEMCVVTAQTSRVNTNTYKHACTHLGGGELRGMQVSTIAIQDPLVTLDSGVLTGLPKPVPVSILIGRVRLGVLTGRARSRRRVPSNAAPRLVSTIKSEDVGGGVAGLGMPGGGGSAQRDGLGLHSCNRVARYARRRDQCMKNKRIGFTQTI